MYGKLLNTIINILFITYLLLLISFYFLHEGIKENINNINYSTVDTVSSQGIFNVDLYNNLKQRVFNYAGADCSYTVMIKYQKATSPGVYETYFMKDTIDKDHLSYPEKNAGESETDFKERLKKVDPNGIISVDFKNPNPYHKNDIISIYLEDQNQTLYGKLITMPFMGMLDSYVDFRIKSLKVSTVGRDAQKLVNGYQVIEEINDTTRTYKIELTTEMSTQLAADARTFSKTQRYDENAEEFAISASKVGKYHIFNTVDYYRVWVDTDLSGTENAGDVVSFYQTTDK